MVIPVQSTAPTIEPTTAKWLEILRGNFIGRLYWPPALRNHLARKKYPANTITNPAPTITQNIDLPSPFLVVP